MLIFAPLDMRGATRADVHRAARLALLRARILKRMDKVESAADQVEEAAAVFVSTTHATDATVKEQGLTLGT